MNLRVAVAGEAKPHERRIRSESEPEEGVEKLLDEVCVGVKGQSNSEIARTPRKAFRCRVQRFPPEVERPIGCEGFTAYQVLTNSECWRAVAVQ